MKVHFSFFFGSFFFVALSNASLNAYADGGGNVSGMGLAAGIGAVSPAEVAGCQGVGLSASGQPARLRRACNVQCGLLCLAGSWAALGGFPVPLQMPASTLMLMGAAMCPAWGWLQGSGRCSLQRWQG